MGAGVIVVALVLKVLFFDIAEVGHNGMAPTLLHGERVLIYKRGKPEVGSIVVCRHPSEDGWVVGRVAASGGMTIDSFGNKLHIDDKPVLFEEKGVSSFYNTDNDLTGSVIWGDEYLGSQPHLIFMAEGEGHRVRETQVPAGKIYLLGDDRAYMGQDSRIYGVVDASTCRGTIIFRLTPLEGLEGKLAHGYFEPIR